MNGRLGAGQGASVSVALQASVDDVLQLAVRSARGDSVPVRELVEVDGRRLRATASIGVVIHPHNGATADTLLEHADAAMFDCKQSTGNACPHRNRAGKVSHHAHAPLRCGEQAGVAAGGLDTAQPVARRAGFHVGLNRAVFDKRGHRAEQPRRLLGLRLREPKRGVWEKRAAGAEAEAVETDLRRLLDER